MAHILLPLIICPYLSSFLAGSLDFFQYPHKVLLDGQNWYLQ